ncbi:hypothetical protein [Natrinema gelatinilyticum]|uniref:hypothetical protein n=1 Tax=Natrinema gelatinilyticum TaxID=2961571 RepID=UPI0020C3B496|nr:hypothetical protein [Natrinema gelatinilyticum]
MKILDTDLWVFGSLRTSEQAAELLAAIDRGEATSAINAYMVQRRWLQGAPRFPRDRPFG